MKNLQRTGLLLVGAILVWGTRAEAQYQYDHHTDHHHHGTTYGHGGGHEDHDGGYSDHRAHYRPDQLKFGGFSHVDDLALRLETISNQFCLDLHYNYSHNPGFRETYAEAYQVLEAARYIHAAEHHNDRRAIQERLGGLDRLFHHVEDDVRGWSRQHHRQIGELGIITKMEMMEEALHHLMNDVGVAQSNIAAGQAPPPGNAGPHTQRAGYPPEPPTFGGFTHVDQLASRLENQANDLCLDLHHNYSHNRGFDETYAEAYQVLEVARYIHAAEHQHDRRAIQEQLDGLDRQFHHVQDDVRGWTRHQHRRVGTGDIESKLEQMESTLHHLMDDVGVTRSPAVDGGAAPPPARSDSHQAPPPKQPRA